MELGRAFDHDRTAATLHAGGNTSIDTAADAAKALEPLAGRFAFLLFSLGIIGTGLLAIPVLAGSAAYSVGEARGWRCGLDERAWEVVGFSTKLSRCPARCEKNHLRDAVLRSKQTHS